MVRRAEGAAPQHIWIDVEDTRRERHWLSMAIEKWLWQKVDIAGEFTRSGSGGEQASEAGTLSGRLGHAG